MQRARYINEAFVILGLLILSLVGCQKDPAIKGKVIDNFNQPLKGVAISIEGMQFTATTDEKGEYSIPYVPGKIKINYNISRYKSERLELDIATKEQIPAKTITLFKYPPTEICIKGENDYVKLKPAKIIENKDGGRQFLLSGEINFTSGPISIMSEKPKATYVVFGRASMAELPIALPIVKDIFGNVLDTKKAITGFSENKSEQFSVINPTPGDCFILIPVFRRLDNLFLPEKKLPAYILVYQPDASARSELVEKYSAAMAQKEMQNKKAEEARRQREEAKRLEDERLKEEQRLARENAQKNQNARTYWEEGERNYKKRNYELAMEYYQKVIQSGASDIFVLRDTHNSMAWIYATCQNANFRNGQKAIKHAQASLEFWEKARLKIDRQKYYKFLSETLDTLAAAYAEAGQFEQASVTQEKATDNAVLAHAPASLVTKYRNRLNLYQKRLTYTE